MELINLTPQYIYHLNSFFTIMISGMLAYSSLPQIREVANHLTFKDYVKKSEDANKNLKQAKNFLNIYGGFSLPKATEDKLNILEKKLGLATKVAEKIFNGGYFQSLFYFSCALNFIFIILGIIQQIFGIRLEWRSVLTLVLPFYLYFAFVFYAISDFVKNARPQDKFVKWLASKFMFNVCAIIYLILVPTILFVENKNYVSEIAEVCILPIEKAWWLRAITLILIASISLIPHIIFYKRYSFFYKGLHLQITQICEEIDTHLGYIKSRYEDDSPINSNEIKEGLKIKSSQAPPA
jgi:hypothetical protein